MSTRFVTTLYFPRRTAWTRDAVCLTSDNPSTLGRFRRLLTGARSGVPVVINGFSVADRVAGIILARLRRDIPLVVSDATWSLGTRRLDRLLTRIGVWLLAGPRTVFCVSSEAERERWPAVWAVPAERLVVVRWYHGIDDLPELPTDGVAGDGTVFSGGHALRDYGTLLSAAARTGVRLDIAADARDLPTDVRFGPKVTVSRVARDEFHRRLAQASLVVVPLLNDPTRSSGQTTYLDAMALGGLVAVSDTLGVGEYIDDGRTGLLFPPGDTDRLAELINWAIDPQNRRQTTAIRRAAAESVRRHFSPDTFVTGLLTAVEVSRGLVPRTRS